MSGGYLIRSVLDLAFLIVGAVGLIGVLKVMNAGLKLAPFPESVRPSVERAGPVLGLAVVIAYVAFAALLISLREPLFAGVLVTLIVVLVMFAWSPLYDLVSGVAFQAGQMCQVGDHVEVGEVSGRVVRLGSRVLVVRTRRGDEAVIPYGRINRSMLQRTQSVQGAYVHAFVLEARPLEEVPRLRKLVLQTALRSPWSSVRLAPKIERREDGQIEVSIFALNADYAPLVESAIRKAVGHEPSDAKPAAADRLPGPPRPSQIKAEQVGQTGGGPSRGE
jgi:hypothetical protein